MARPNNQQTVLLADTFPAKAYLLIAHLTEADPSVSRFSSDGASFEIYDQGVFAQKYLPQYFKHANYGSFVRQLNLYGFTSSRLKQNSDVVVWTHQYFRRDEQELVKQIKRTKKAKVAKPSQAVHIDPRSPSPPSLSDEVSTEYPSKPPSGKTFSIKNGAGVVDQVWLESEFLLLKRQNQFLEQKLDAQSRFLEEKLNELLQVTLRISASPPLMLSRGANHPSPQAGEKRRRTSPVESGEVSAHAAHAPRHLLSLSEEQKLYDDGGDNDYRCGLYSEQRLFYDENYGIEQAACPPYGGDDRKMPAKITQNDGAMGNAIAGPSSERDDSLTRFVNIMLEEEDEEEDKDRASQQKGGATALPPPAASDEMTLDEALMEEAMNTILPEDSVETGQDLFGPLAPTDASRQGAQSHPNGNPTWSVGYANAKSDAPPVQATVHRIESSEDVPVSQGHGDLEEGNLPVGVAVVSAELVPEAGDTNDGDGEEEAAAIQRERVHGERRDRKRALCLLAVIGVALVAGVTWPAVVKANRDEEIRNEVKERVKERLSSEDGPPIGGRPDCRPGFWRDRHGKCQPPHKNPDYPSGQDKEGPEEEGESDYGDHDGLFDRPSDRGSDDPMAGRGTEGLGKDDEDSRDNEDNEDEGGAGVAGRSDGNLTGVFKDIAQERMPSVIQRARRKKTSSLFDNVHDGTLSSFSVKLAGTEFFCNSGR